jgi:hypothetical protein
MCKLDAMTLPVEYLESVQSIPISFFGSSDSER